VRDVAASHEKIIRLFERIHFFLQRLNIYIGLPLTNELMELLGKITTQLLCILALSTKAMTEGRMSEFIDSLFLFSADHGKEKILKKLAGRTDVEDALEMLDTLTKEETSMTVARSLEVTHRVDDNVNATQDLVQNVDGNVNVIKEVIRNVDGNVKATKELSHDVDGNVKVIKELTYDVSDNVKEMKEVIHDVQYNVKATKNGMRPSYVYLYLYAHTDYFFLEI
jgi:methyl-accepting chemotaxis protein